MAGSNPCKDLQVLRHELEAYKIGLTSKPSLVIANKADLTDMARRNIQALSVEAGDGVPVIPVSAKERKNILRATSVLRKLVESVRK